MPFDTTDPASFGQFRRPCSLALWLVPAVYAVCALGFVSDLQHADTLPYGLFYAPLIATAVLHRQNWGLWVLTWVASLLVVIGGLPSLADADLPELITNRALSLLAILTTTAFVRRGRLVRERLAAETRRAEIAERIKAEMLTNLSEELRTPLHSLLGVLSLMMLQCRPDQKAVLRNVQAGGKQLLSTVDNLIDLAQSNQWALRRQPVSVATILRDAADEARCIADERGVTIVAGPSVLEASCSEVSAIGDAWATRRILDNLIANAVRFSPPGSVVWLAVDQTSGQVTASVRDSGTGLRADLTAGLGADGSSPAPEGVGLTLSSRLAEAMDGNLSLESGAQSGSSVTLRLPSAMQDAA